MQEITISAAQCRAARGLLGLSQAALARSAHITDSTIARFERDGQVPTYNNLRAIYGALVAAGVAFVAGNGGGSGVRLQDVEKNDQALQMILFPELCRAARNIVGFSQEELARAAEVGRSTVTDFERGARIPTSESLAALRGALEAAGVSFIAADAAGGPGVRLQV